jgi:hypothetical protein
VNYVCDAKLACLFCHVPERKAVDLVVLNAGTGQELIRLGRTFAGVPCVFAGGQKLAVPVWE